MHNQALRAAYSDAELLAIESRLHAAITPSEPALVQRWMAPAITPAERARSAVLEFR